MVIHSLRPKLASLAKVEDIRYAEYVGLPIDEFKVFLINHLSADKVHAYGELLNFKLAKVPKPEEKVELLPFK